MATGIARMRSWSSWSEAASRGSWCPRPGRAVERAEEGDADDRDEHRGDEHLDEQRAALGGDASCCGARREPES